MSYFPFYRLTDQDTDCLLVPVEQEPECPIERAEKAAIRRFIDCNPGVAYTVEKTRKYGHVTIVVKAAE